MELEKGIDGERSGKEAGRDRMTHTHAGMSSGLSRMRHHRQAQPAVVAQPACRPLGQVGCRRKTGQFLLRLPHFGGASFPWVLGELPIAPAPLWGSQLSFTFHGC